MNELETAKMSDRGQIIIPKEIRDYIGASENTIFTIMSIDKETIIMKKLDKIKILEEFRSIRKNVREKINSIDINKEIKESRK